MISLCLRNHENKKYKDKEDKRKEAKTQCQSREDEKDEFIPEIKF